MKKLIIIPLMLFAVLLYGCSERQVNSSTATEPESMAQTTLTSEKNSENDKEIQEMLKIEVNGHTLLADFENNSSAEALKEKLKNGSIEIEMSDYGSFEKVGDLPFSLPRNDENITTEAGDVILYQGNKLTIYYDTNSWSFTRIAKIRNANTDLKKILGSGDVTVRLSLEAE